MEVKEQRATSHFIGNSRQRFSLENKDKMTFTGTTEYITDGAISAVVKKLN